MPKLKLEKTTLCTYNWSNLVVESSLRFSDFLAKQNIAKTKIAKAIMMFD